MCCPPIKKKKKKKLPKRPHETKPRHWLGISWLDTSYPKSPLYRCTLVNSVWDRLHA